MTVRQRRWVTILSGAQLAGQVIETNGVSSLSFLSNVHLFDLWTFLGPLEKLTSLIEDIFEAEDSLPPEVESSDLNHEFFSPLSLDCSRPLLATAIIRKLTKYIGHVARPAKRLRQATVGVIGTPRGKGRMGDLDVQQLSRLLKILDRSVKAGEDIDPFPHAHVSSLPSSTKSSPKKPSNKKISKPRKRSRSATPKQGDNTAEDNEEHRAGSLTVPTDADIDKLSTQLDAARDSIFAADCCIALLGSDRLPKQVRTNNPCLMIACLIVY
jgi:cohesin loading factor subunit SCC2